MGYTATKITEIGDPFVLNDGGVYYLYATHDSRGIFCWRGADLNDLQPVGLIYNREESFGYECFWAPEVVRRRDGKYVMHFTARDRKDGILRTGVAVSDSPAGHYTDYTRGQPMFDIGVATIDASCLVCEAGAFLYFVLDCSTNVVNGVHTSEIYVCALDESLCCLQGEPVLAATPTQDWETEVRPAATEALAGKTRSGGYLWNEGPSVIEHDGKYHLTYSAFCFDNPKYSVGCAVADSPMGPFVKYDNNPILCAMEGLSGPGHNSFFTGKDGKTYCAFHCHTDIRHPSGDRRFCYCPVCFEGGKLKLLYK